MTKLNLNYTMPNGASLENRLGITKDIALVATLEIEDLIEGKQRNLALIRDRLDIASEEICTIIEQVNKQQNSADDSPRSTYDPKLDDINFDDALGQGRN